MDEVVEEQKPKPTRRGWPKGKKRGQRRVSAAELVVEPKPKRRTRPVEEYHDPIDVTVRMKDGSVCEFSCADYDTSGSVWKFKSFSKERGRQTVRMANPSEVAFVEIAEPEGRVSAPAPNVAMPMPGVPYMPSYQAPPMAGPQTYVARDPGAFQARGGIVGGIPRSVAKDENGNVTVLGAAMIGSGDIGG